MNYKSELDIKIINNALKKGYSICSHNGMISQFHLTENQYSLVCLNCKKQIVLASGEELIQKVETIKACDCEKKDFVDVKEIIEATKSGEMYWIYDPFGVFKFLVDGIQDGFSNPLKKNRLFPEDFKLASDYTIFFTRYNERNYLLWEASEKQNGKDGFIFVCTFAENSVLNIPSLKAFGVEGSVAELISSIVQESRTTFPNEAQGQNNTRIFDVYIDMLNSVIDKTLNETKTNLSQEELGALKKYDEFFTLNENTVTLDECMREYLSVHMCPVCHRYHKDGTSKCHHCGYSELNRMFLNKDEINNWKKNSVEPYREKTNYVDYRFIYNQLLKKARNKN